MVVAFRRHPVLPLDDYLRIAAVDPAPEPVSAAPLPAAPRHLLPARHEGDKPKHQRFKRYPIGLLHMDITEAQTAGRQATEGHRKLLLLAGIDHTNKLAVTQLVANANRRQRGSFSSTC